MPKSLHEYAYFLPRGPFGVKLDSISAFCQQHGLTDGASIQRFVDAIKSGESQVDLGTPILLARDELVPEEPVVLTPGVVKVEQESPEVIEIVVPSVDVSPRRRQRRRPTVGPYRRSPRNHPNTYLRRSPRNHVTSE